jgi:site-specific DNA-cytosine methylase
MARVIGLLCGSGNLLFEAQQQGVEVVGNIEMRGYYHSANWVWKNNFTSPLVRSFNGDEFDPEWYDADIAIGHPPCGSFSTLGQSKASKDTMNEEERREWNRKRNAKAGMLPEFIQMVNLFKPRVFAMDNLVKMLEAYPKSWWREQLPDYRITTLDIWNWSFGSPQRRRRCWVIGVRRKIGAGRFELSMPKRRLKGPRTTWEAISDLPWEPWIDIDELAHTHHVPPNRAMGSFRFMGRTTTAGTVGQTALGYLGLPPGKLWPYRNAHGRLSRKPGHVRVALDRPCRTLSKMETLRHPLTGWPLTPRERARVMGWPDEFRLDREGVKFQQDDLRKLSVITGKAVPNEFVRYLIPQLLDHIGAR